MARPHKEGIDYFSLDVNFYDNKKVRRIIRACGPAAGTILTCLLCNIYGGKGYYITWDGELPFDIADKIGVSEGAVSEVITKALQVDFFSSYQHETNSILTSEEIQKRYKSATLKRQETIVDKKYSVFSGGNGVIDGRNSGKGVGNTQSKEKVKDSKVNNRAKALVGTSPDVSATLQIDYKKIIDSLAGKERKDIWVSIRDFIVNNKPGFIDPYVDAWNVFAPTCKLATVEAISESRKKKFKTRIQEESFDFLKILEKIKCSPHLKGDNNGGWKVTFDWIFENDKNYVKIIEGNYN